MTAAKQKRRAKSKFDTSPKPIRDWINNALDDGVMTYAEMSAELTEKGHPISSVSIFRHNKRRRAKGRLPVARLAEFIEATHANLELKDKVTEYGVLCFLKERLNQEITADIKAENEASADLLIQLTATSKTNTQE